jgi:hypothetical protein
VDSISTALSTVVSSLNAAGVKASQSQLSRLQERGTAVFGEILALRLADYIRTNIDQGMCAIGDLLLDELGKAVALELPQMTSIADSEFFGKSSRVIRLRFPAISLWELPVLGHEFGHYFGPLWYSPDGPDPHPQQTFVKNTALGSRITNDELFCDLLATYMIGPAYPAMCIVDRFSPTSDTDTPTHPSDIKRAWWVLRCLELWAQALHQDDQQEFTAKADTLRGWWQTYHESSGTAQVLDSQRTTLELAAQKLTAKCRLELPQAGYQSLDKAWGLRSQVVGNCAMSRPVGNPNFSRK